MKKILIKGHLSIIANIILIVIGLAGLFMIVNQKSPAVQATASFCRVLDFEGEYRIGDGDWQPYMKGQHISATSGDVTIRGHFYLGSEEDKMIVTGHRLCFYLNHLSVEAYHNGELYYMSDCENKYIGNISCGKIRNSNLIYPATAEDTFEIVFKNPHRFGNGMAIDEFFANIYSGDLSALKDQLQAEFALQSTIALVILILGFVLLGVTVFSTFLQIPQAKILWLLTAMSLFAGGWFYFSAESIPLWNGSIAITTAGYEISRMYYGFFASCLVVAFLNDRLKFIGKSFASLLGIAVAGLIMVPAITGMKIYDVQLIWMIAQAVVGVGIAILCVMNLAQKASDENSQKIASILGIIAAAAMLADMAAVGFHWRIGAVISKGFFVLFFVSALLVALKIVPTSIRQAIRAKELELELEEQKTSIMISQIQPHFLYNCLTTIRSLCRKDPEQAWSAIGDFASYLRGNINSITSKQDIPFSSELKHIKTYLHLEHLRIGDRLVIVYDIQEEDFFLPAWTIQPLVENAVKHGIYEKPEGGTVTLRTKRVGDEIIISVADTGVGYDASVPIADDEQKTHVGIKNVRNRLDKLMGATLTIESKPGSGTVATVRFHVKR